MTKREGITFRYSISFKQNVVKEVENGTSIGEVCRKYGIKGGSTVQQWIKKMGKSELLNKVVEIKTMGERDRTKELENQVKELKIALAESVIAQRCLESLIAQANENYQTDLKKSFGSPFVKN